MDSNSKIEVNLIFNKSQIDWLQSRTIFLTRYGSYAYGTNRFDSDIDIRGVCTPPASYYLGLAGSFEQHVSSDPFDLTIFGINKFLKLALDNNPNALEILFTDESDHLFVSSRGKELLELKSHFLSKKARFTFAGYASSQLRRIIRHRSWILKPILEKPERSTFDLPEGNSLIPQSQMLEIEAEVQKKISDWEIDTTGLENDAAIKFRNELYNKLIDLKINHDDMHVYAARSLGLNDNLLFAFKKEKVFKNALKEWNDFNVWKKTRNKKRFELEEKYHYDVKHGMHLVRLYRQCIELLRDCKLNVRRPDAPELLEIRNGAWSFDELIEWAKKQDLILDELYKTSLLPKEPNKELINNWLINALSCMIKEQK